MNLILMKVVFAYKSLRPTVLAVSVLLHKNGNLWLIPQDSAHALASLASKGKTGGTLYPLAPAWP